MEQLGRIGVDVARLSVVHVAGTKGKGSTVAMTEALLRQDGIKTGMFVSPHLVEPRERIRINGKPLSEAQFADFFWRTLEGLQPSPPPFFRFLNCMSFLVFQELAVDVAVVEVGVGGRACSTNVVSPVVTAITRLGYDHMDVLGSTLTEIAAEKAGIIKQRVPCFASPQLPEGEQELRRRAAERESELVFVEPLAAETRLGPEGDFQRLKQFSGLPPHEPAATPIQH